MGSKMLTPMLSGPPSNALHTLCDVDSEMETWITSRPPRSIFPFPKFFPPPGGITGNAEGNLKLVSTGNGEGIMELVSTGNGCGDMLTVTFKLELVPFPSQNTWFTNTIIKTKLKSLEVFPLHDCILLSYSWSVIIIILGHKIIHLGFVTV